MQQLSAHGQQFIQDLAQRYGVSTDAAITMLYAVMNGNGTMAQFSHPELGGSGQWMQGGMTMVGDMFNYGLKSKVDGLCVEISNQIMNQPGYFQPAQSQFQSSGNTSGGNLFVSAAAAGQWWPGDLGSPSSTGGQNNVRYAVFPGSRRLVVDIGGQVTVYDTLDNQIGGVSQQQGGNDSMTFSSQYGTITVNSLPVLSINGYQPQQQPQQNFMAPPVQQFNEPPAYQAPSAQEGDVFAKIERLADLFKKGILTEQEFSNKKMELLNQL
ncbi:MAG: SHOCT domain-containing protein [Betaproteobacteria bacterium]|nr:SHOCT domain-containing protein [Betaproteobacteria bacterium]